jgi:hypothetical protein
MQKVLLSMILALFAALAMVGLKRVVAGNNPETKYVPHLGDVSAMPPAPTQEEVESPKHSDVLRGWDSPEQEVSAYLSFLRTGVLDPDYWVEKIQRVAKENNQPLAHFKTSEAELNMLAEKNRKEAATILQRYIHQR